MPDYLKELVSDPEFGDSEHAIALERAFASIHEQKTDIKMFATHYPRADLPGRCIGIEVVLHNVPDPMVADDVEAAEEFARTLHEKFSAPGMLFEVRQVWQLDGEVPRLIEATVELTDEFDRLMQRNPPLGFFGDPAVERITFDKARGCHFAAFGGGRRRGLIWVDRSCGIGDPDPWSSAYQLRPTRRPDAPLPSEVIKTLQEFVKRF